MQKKKLLIGNYTIVHIIQLVIQCQHMMEIIDMISYSVKQLLVLRTVMDKQKLMYITIGFIKLKRLLLINMSTVFQKQLQEK